MGRLGHSSREPSVWLTGTYGWQADARPETMIANAKESARRLDFLVGGVELAIAEVLGRNVPSVPFCREILILGLRTHSNSPTSSHTYQHEIRTAREAGVLGSLDANQGDKLIGWV